MNKTTSGALAALLMTLPLVATAPASARHGADDGATHVQGGGGASTARSGSCSGSTDWRIKARPDDGRLEVEAEIDSNHRGQTWRWVLRHDGHVVARGRSVTAGRSGSFQVERRTRNAAGADALRFRATNVRSGEVCVARLTR
jgi:hypothetical protein